MNGDRKSLASGLAALVLACIGSMALAAAPAAEEKPGYDDTPLLPDSPWRVHDRNRPQAPMVEPGREPGAAPADAVVLFDGRDVSPWNGLKADAVEGGAINVAKTKGIRTKQEFGDCQLHIEWATPAKADGSSMNWGNSGIFFHGLYELQIIESKASRIYADGIAGAIYGQYPPLVNPSRGPGEWQTFDAVFVGPRFDGGKLVEPARMTVFWNGVLILYHQKVLGETQHKTFPEYKSKLAAGPLEIQQHSSAVLLRNIWIRPLKQTEQ
ncbi:MAG: 3-keto-disaccharide hydrolase [Thermoguttaceae bacterium]